MRSAHKLVTLLTPVALLALGPSMAHATPTNLIADGSFETPAVGPGGVNTGYLTFNVGQTIGGVWQVTGNPSGNVALTPNTETSLVNGVLIQLPAADGNAFQDLSGTSDSSARNGVSQIFATMPGQLYALSFYVSNVNNGSYPGTATSIDVGINDSVIMTATNNETTGLSLAWEPFSATFIASGPVTKLGFTNASSPVDDVVGLDNVGVRAVPFVTVPEPGTFAVMGIALLGLIGARGLRRRQTR